MAWAWIAVTSCGGPLPTNSAGEGVPAAIAQVRLFDPSGADLTVHTGLPDDQSVRVEVRLYAGDGHRLTDIVGGSMSPEVEIGALALGYARRIREVRGAGAWLGVRGNVELIPDELRLFYGSRTPTGVIVYVQLRAPVMAER